MATIYSICMITLLLCLLIFNAGNATRKMIIDTDAGGDDALAIMLALRYSDIEVIAITCTYGNTYLSNVVQNVLKILTVANKSDIPVYKGNQGPLIHSQSYEATDYFGKDGFGDFQFNQTITAVVDESKHASVAIVNLVKQYPGEITLVSLAPVTNIALAVKLYPMLPIYLKEYIIMGSSGTRVNQAEFNFKQDPESASIILDMFQGATVIPASIMYDSGDISKSTYEELYNQLNPTIANFLRKAERIAINKTATWQPIDGIALAIAIQPDIILKSFQTFLDVVTCGNNRGSTIIEIQYRNNSIIIAQEYDKCAFQSLLVTCLS